MADSELAAKLQKQIARNEGLSNNGNVNGQSSSSTSSSGDENAVMPSRRVFNPYTDFKEFSRRDIQSLEKTFKT